MSLKWSNHGKSTLPRALAEAAAKWPDKIYLDFSGQTYTYAEVEREATRIAHGLASLGVARGDRVCSLLDNVSDQIFFWYAAMMLDAVYVPINTDLKGEFLRHQLADAGAAVTVSEAHYAERFVAIEQGIPALHTLIIRGGLPQTQTRFTELGLDSVRSDNDARIESSSKAGDLAMLIYTSGTTGPSKGCMMSHGYLYDYACRWDWMTRLTAEDVFWTPCPLFHLAALTGAMGAVMVGATASFSPRFSASNFWPEIERSGATAVMLLSIMLSIIPDAPDTEISKRCYGQLRTVFGAPLNGDMKKKWKERFGVKHVAQPAYGLTETGLIAITPVDTPDVPDGASGRRCDEFDVRIVDDDGEECPPGVAGEIILRPLKRNVMFQGYWQRPEENFRAMRELWFHTGDIGKFDENDFFYFLDRKKDYLRKGGENVSSFEVESTFLAHPHIAEVAVHSVLSEISEDELKVTAVLKPDAVLTEEELFRWSMEQLPRFAIPTFVEFREYLPRTPSGRVQKFQLRDQGITDTTWDRRKSNIALPTRPFQSTIKDETGPESPLRKASDISS